MTEQKTDQHAAPASTRPPGTRPHRAAGVTENDIARRAYDLYLARGGEDGHHIEDWLRAECELREAAENSTSSAN